MEKGKFSFILCIEVQTLTNSIKNYFNISFAEARKWLYCSKLYSALEIEETKMWYYSCFDLFNMFIEERETGDYTIYGG